MQKEEVTGGGGACPHLQLQDRVSDTCRLVQRNQHKGGQIHRVFNAPHCLQPVRERAPMMSRVLESNLKKKENQTEYGRRRSRRRRGRGAADHHFVGTERRLVGEGSVLLLSFADQPGHRIRQSLVVHGDRLWDRLSRGEGLHHQSCQPGDRQKDRGTVCCSEM